MLDFTSCSYLGLRHGADKLPPWSAISEGRPAALHEPKRAADLGQAMARTQGQEDGVVGASSLLLAMDVLGPALRGGDWHILVDAGCYPTLTWAAAQHGPPQSVGHHDTTALAGVLARLGPGARPLLVVDGFCPGCGRIAPLAEYVGLLGARAGRLLVDDTQALGVLGLGGAGTVATKVPMGSPVLCLTSLAKGFGVPIATLSGPRQLIEAFRADSMTRVHCSPPSWPTVLAAVHALAMNREFGGRLRRILRRRVVAFRRACTARAVPLLPSFFPVQSVAVKAHQHEDAASLVTGLMKHGVRAYASRGFHDPIARPRLIITAAHIEPEIEVAAAALAAVLSPASRRGTQAKGIGHVESLRDGPVRDPALRPATVGAAARLCPLGQAH